MREGWSPPKVNLNIICGRGGLGDAIARIPAIRYMHDNYLHVSSTLYIQDGWLDIVKYLLPETYRRVYRKLSDAPFYMQRPYIEFDMERVSTLHMHLTDHAFVILMDMLPPSISDKAYPKAEMVYGDTTPWTVVEFESGVTIPHKEIEQSVVFTTDYTAPSREWPVVYINALAKKCLGAGLQPVLLGTTKRIPSGVEYDPIKPNEAQGLKTELFVDLRNKTTLIEALGVMQRAKAVVGLDNGLIHLAHCTNTPVVVGFTSLKPEHRVPVRLGPPLAMDLLIDKDYDRPAARGAELTETVVAQIPCAGCQSRGFSINTDWRVCLFDDYACCLTLTDSRFWDKLKELGVVE